MPLSKTLEQYLRQHGVDYDVVAHRVVYTAYDLAATLKEKLGSIGKTLLIRADNAFVLVVLPADRRVDLVKLKKALGAKKISMVSEKEMIAKLKVKAGGLSSFGSLHKAEVVVDKALTKASHALLAAGSFTDSLRMKMKDFVQLEHARVHPVSAAAKLPKLTQARSSRTHRRGSKRPKKSKRS